MIGQSNYGQDEMRCPACGAIALSESIDVGVGLCIKGDFSCGCGWEIYGPEDFGFLGMNDVPFAPAHAVPT